uniref:AAT10 n=1 Tax=Sinonovacula rivularis TaxID=489091 RepID=A0AA49X8H3_9BIVA|nr:AAT10 [Sinonovacula rivularis]
MVTDVLATGDYVALALYFALVMAVGLWSTFNQNRGSTEGYFLAGKNMHWWPVGASVYSSNVGAPMFIGLAGTAAASGIAVTIFEWHAVYIIISLGWLFVPVYVASGAYTMPEYLRMRFGGRRIRTHTAVLSLLVYILRNISGEIYCGAIFMQQILGWNIYMSVSLILIVVAVYTIIGGLRAVIFTDTLQTAVLFVGAFVVCGISINQVGGWFTLVTKYTQAATNYTLQNTSFYGCGMPRDDAFHIFRDPVTGDLPWTGATLGLTILALFVWCQDQLIVQRCLSAKNLAHAKGGTLLAATLKFASFPMFVIPGMISRILYTDEVACAEPEKCMEACNSPSGCSDIAYPLLVLRILPEGVRGLMLAGLMAGVMSTLTSVFNSASSIVTLDLWGQFRKSASQAELMVVGRLTVLVLVVISILWLPILQQQQGGLLWFYIASVCAYLTVPWCIAFLLGLLWKRTSEAGIFWGMMAGLLVGVVYMGLVFATPPPVCGSGEPDRRLSIVARVDFLHFSILNGIFCTVVMVVISLFTSPRTEEQLHRVTWWTRHDIQDPELTEDEDDTASADNIPPSLPGTSSPQTTTYLDIRNRSVLLRLKLFLYSWVCGIQQGQRRHVTAEEREIIRRKMTSIKQGKNVTRFLNAYAVFLCLAITFLFGFFG